MSNLLFADGSAAVLVGSNTKSANPEFSPINIDSFHSVVLHEGQREMAWELSERGFLMNLSSYVSGLLNGNMPALFKDQNIGRSEISHWAVHPGGLKILDEFCSAMQLKKQQLASSYKVLSDFGNMSSATILFVLKQLIHENGTKIKGKIFTAAFGPGLTIESAILRA